MKTFALLIALSGASLLMPSMSHAAPSTNPGAKMPAADIMLHLTAAKKSIRKPLPKSLLKLRGSNAPSGVQGSCTWGNDNIAHCEDCEVDWDDLTMLCIANMICYDHYGKRIACP